MLDETVLDKEANTASVRLHAHIVRRQLFAGSLNSAWKCVVFALKLMVEMADLVTDKTREELRCSRAGKRSYEG